MMGKEKSESILSPLLVDEPQMETLTLCYKVMRTVTLFWLWLCFGAFSEITGPVIPELIVQTNSQYDTIAQSVAMRGAGHALGGIIGGLMVDRWFHYIDVLTSMALILYTAVGVGAAYVESIAVLFAAFFAQGSIETWLQTAGYRIAFTIWQEKSAGPVHALHMGYGIGTVLVLQLVTPFLDPRFSEGVIQTGYNSSCWINKTTTLIQFPSSNLKSQKLNITATLGPLTPKYPANFVTAYWILSGISLATAVVFMMYYIHGRVTGVRIDRIQNFSNTARTVTFRESISPTTCSPSHPTYAGLIITTLVFYYAIAVPLIRAFSKFIFSYARDGPCLSVTESTSLETAYFVAVSVGRLSAFLLSSVLHMKYILQIEVLGVLGCMLILFFLHDNIIVLWTFCTALGFFTGPIIPSSFAWANRYIEVTSTAQIIPEVGAAMGDIIFLLLVGYSYQHYGPYILWSYQLALAVGICLVAWIMQIFGTLHGDRYHKADEKSY